MRVFAPFCGRGDQPLIKIMTNSLVQDALKKVGAPEILVNVISKRVRQLGQGFRPLLEVQPRWSFMEIALREVSEGKLTFEEVADAEESTRPSKKRKEKAAPAVA